MKNKKIHFFYNVKNFRFNSVWFKNFLITIVLEILLVGFLIGFYTYQIEKNTADEIMDMHKKELQRSAEILDTVVEQMNNFAYYFSVENDMEILFINSKIGEESTVYKSISSRMKSFRRTFDYVKSVYVYMEDAGLVIGENAVTDLDDARDFDLGWYAFYEEIGEQSYILRSRCAKGEYPFLLTMLLTIRDGQNDVIGAVIIDIDIEELNSAIGRSSKDNQKVYMVDEDGRLLYSSVPRTIKYENMIPETLTELSHNEAGTVIMEEQGSEIIVTVENSKSNRWKYVMYGSVASYNNQMAAVRRKMLQISFMAISIGVLLSCIIAVQSYRPIQHIMNEVENYEEIKDDFISGENAKNEVQYIARLIRNTTRQNKMLTAEVSEWVEKLGHAQLMALQSQINPHFLYNTLDAINWLAMDQMGKMNDVSKAMASLAKLLRLSMNRSSYLVPLKDEIEHAELYMYLMNIRYSGKIEVYWNIPQYLQEKKVIRLCLQPILENAVRHGLKEKRYKGSIRISGDIVNDVLIIRVQDDGKGISVEECRKRNRELYTNYQLVDDHVGIANVNQRIKIVFGEEYGVLLRPGEVNGLVVALCFPAD